MVVFSMRGGYETTGQDARVGSDGETRVGGADTVASNCTATQNKTSPEISDHTVPTINKTTSSAHETEGVHASSDSVPSGQRTMLLGPKRKEKVKMKWKRHHSVRGPDHITNQFGVRLAGGSCWDLKSDPGHGTMGHTQKSGEGKHEGVTQHSQGHSAGSQQDAQPHSPGDQQPTDSQQQLQTLFSQIVSHGLRTMQQNPTVSNEIGTRLWELHDSVRKLQQTGADPTRVCTTRTTFKHVDHRVVCPFLLSHPFIS